MNLRHFSVVFEGVAVSAAQDLFQIEANTVPLALTYVELSNRSDVGDAEAEGLPITIKRVTDEVTDDVNASKFDPGSAAENAQLAINETTQLTTGEDINYAGEWNIQTGPFIWLPPPEKYLWCKVGDAICVSLEAAPADAVTMSGVAHFCEIAA